MGLALDTSGYEVVVGDRRVGPRRSLSDDDVALLHRSAARYVDSVRRRADTDVFASLGCELFRWLDGDQGQLTQALARASRPVVFEVRAPASPSDAGWAVLRAPWELLARPNGGFLAAEALLRFTVVRRLGRAVEPSVSGGYRLGLAFMASSPRGQQELDFEAEEAAILSAVGDTRVDLVVDDSGDPVQLGRRLADLGGLPVVHLSCHGSHAWRPTPEAEPVPALWMEDELGNERPTTAAELVGMLAHPPRLLFVSACLTATGADTSGHLPSGPGQRVRDLEPLVSEASEASGTGVAHSLATALVDAGMPAVLGWDGSVDDRSATRFAEKLYARLGEQVDLAVAVAEARRVLLDSDDPIVHRDWHLARLWLGPTGGGRLVAGTRRRSMVPANHATKTFLDRKQHVPVTVAAMFVGRRLELQRSLRALRSGDRAGVLLHGQGRLGKSSLAARIADRCPDRAVAVVFGDYTPLAILDAIAAAVRTHPAARDLVDRGVAQVRQRPEALETVLIDLLTGPCAQAGEPRRPGEQPTERPLLLIIDDLEQILEPCSSGPHRVAGEHAAVLASVLRAFHPAETDSRLVLTSRFTFSLDGHEQALEHVQLPPLSPVAQVKLHRRQRASATATERQVADRAALAERAVTISRGNPGLQDVAVLRLVYGSQVSADRAEAAITEMETYLRQGDLPTDAEVRAFLEKIAIDALITQAGPTHVPLLRAATLFDLPVPEPVLDVLAGTVGGSVSRLRGLGLLDSFPDHVDPTRPAVAANGLAAGRLDPLTGEEQETFARLAVGPLFTAWGGTTHPGRRDLAAQLELTGLALLADDSAVVAACAAHAVLALRQGPAAAAFRLGHEAIALLDRHGRSVPTDLFRQTADAAQTSGDGAVALALLQRAIDRQSAASDPPATGGEADANLLDHARVFADYANLLLFRGDVDLARDHFQRAQELFTAAGSVLEAAAATGGIADIAFQRGDYEEALRIRREVELPVFERLGDARSVAVTWGEIADIAFQRGDYEEALRIHREVELPVYERLGDTRTTTVCWGKVATIAFRRGDYEEALRIRREVELPVYERLGDDRSAAVAWGRIADIAFRRGEYEEALQIRREVELPVYERLGDLREMALCWWKIAEIAHERGQYDEAATLRQRCLAVNEQIGDRDGIAAATWGLAQIDLVREDYKSAAPRLIAAFQLFNELGRPDGLAVVGYTLGQFLFEAGQHDDARNVLDLSEKAAAKVGMTDLVGRLQDLRESLPDLTTGE